MGDLTLGWVADHLGHRPVLITGVVAAVGRNALALLSPSIESLGVVFGAAGRAFRRQQRLGLNVLLEFAPSAAGSAYIGLGLTTVAPLAFAAPILAGLVADARGDFLRCSWWPASSDWPPSCSTWRACRDRDHRLETPHGG